MSIPTLANRPKAGWAVLLYGPPPEIQLLAGELDDSGLEIVRIGDHFFLQAPEVFDPLSWSEELAWAAVAVLQQLNTAARLRYAVRLPPYWSTMRAFGIRMKSTAPKSEETSPALSRFPWRKFGQPTGGGLILLAP